MQFAVKSACSPRLAGSGPRVVPDQALLIAAAPGVCLLHVVTDNARQARWRQAGDEREW
jgi:hypothetical protein